MKHHTANHRQELPSGRKIRRSCQSELYRTLKRMKVWIAPEKLELAEKAYYKKVVQHAVWLNENRMNRKKQVDWWEEACADELVTILEVDREAFITAFREAYGG